MKIDNFGIGINGYEFNELINKLILIFNYTFFKLYCESVLI